MLIRVAVATQSKDQADYILNKLVSYSLRSIGNGDDVEFDISFYNELHLLLNAYIDKDIMIVSYKLLAENIDILSDFYHKNPLCLPVPIGNPEGVVCKYLSLRPAFRLQEQCEQEDVDLLCAFCVREMVNRDDIIQVRTKRGDYIISAAAILFCQSDLKYVIMNTVSGQIYRKCGKLDDLESELPDFFIRVHKSYLVNSRHIVGLDKSNWEILLDEGSRLPVSRSYQKNTAAFFQKKLFDD